MVKLLTIADGITLLNAIFGFLAIIMLVSEQIRISFSLILLALLADGLDGIIARKIGKGKIGEYLEAMADMISLSIAPMIFVYKIYYKSITSDVLLQLLLITVFLIFLISSIIRLSSFHILKEKKFFIGLPASASTVFIIILAFVNVNFFYILPFIIVVSIAMISNIHFPKPGFKVNVIATLLIFIAIIAGKIYNNIALIVLFTAFALYSLAGPIYLKKSVS